MPKAKKTDSTTVANEVAVATTAKKTTRKPSAKVELFIEHNGIQASTDAIAKKIKAAYAEKENAAVVKTLKIYVKPEENTAYYVVNGEEECKLEGIF